MAFVVSILMAGNTNEVEIAVSSKTVQCTSEVGFDGAWEIFHEEAFLDVVEIDLEAANELDEVVIFRQQVNVHESEIFL